MSDLAEALDRSERRLRDIGAAVGTNLAKLERIENKLRPTLDGETLGALHDAIEAIRDEVNGLEYVLPDDDDREELNGATLEDVASEAKEVLETLDELTRYGFDRAGIVLFEARVTDLRRSIHSAGL